MSLAPLLFFASVALNALAQAFSPGRPKPDPSAVKIPTASASRQIPYAFGTVLIRDANVIWFGNVQSLSVYRDVDPGGNPWIGDTYQGTSVRNKFQWLQLDIHYALTHGVVREISGIMAGETEMDTDALPWTLSYSTPVVEADFSIDALDWGQDTDRDGVLKPDEIIQPGGSYRVLVGRSDVDERLYGLVARIFAEAYGPTFLDSPQFQGITSIVFRGGIGAYPYVDPVSFRVTRLPADEWHETEWYTAKAGIVLDSVTHANPAHVLYDLLTSTRYGVGIPTAQIDGGVGGTWRDTADTLYTEGLGISGYWDEAATAQERILEVLSVVEGAIYSDATTGLIQFRLIREDYTVGDLYELDESNVLELVSYQRLASSETPNQVTYRYRTPGFGAETSGIIQDIAAVHARGQVINRDLDLSIVANAALAVKLASRELLQLSRQPATYRLKVNRACLPSIYPSAPVKFSWGPLGISAQVVRIGEIDYGSPDDDSVTITAVTDDFGVADAVYSEPPETEWTDPRNDPERPDVYLLEEMPYHYLLRTSVDAWGYTDPSWPATLESGAATYACIMAAIRQPTGDTMGFNLALYDTATPAPVDQWRSLAFGGACPWGEVDGEHWFDATSIAISDSSGLDIIGAGSMAWIAYRMDIGGVDVEGWECVLVESVTKTAGVVTAITISRGILDTTPCIIPDGATILCPQHDSIVFPGPGMCAPDRFFTVGSPANDYDFRMLTMTMGGLRLSIDDAAPSITRSFRKRYILPYSVGNVQVNGEIAPRYICGAIALTWAHRNRAEQIVDDHVTEQDETGYTRPVGMTYDVEIVADETGGVSHGTSGETGTSYSIESERVWGVQGFYWIWIKCLDSGGKRPWIPQYRLVDRGFRALATQEIDTATATLDTVADTDSFGEVWDVLVRQYGGSLAISQAGAQLASLSLDGITPDNSYGGATIAWSLVDAAGTRTLSLYADAGRTQLVAEGTRAGDGVMALDEENDSGLTGSVTIAYTGDEDGTIEYETHSRMAVVHGAWDDADGGSIAWSEAGTADIGDTTDVTLDAVKSTHNALLRATTASDNWLLTARRWYKILDEEGFAGMADTSVDTGTTTIDTFEDTDYEGGCRWMVRISDGTNSRTCTVLATWDNVADSTPAYAEYGSGDVGDTSDVTFEVDKDGNDVRLRATSTSDGWTAYVQRFPM